MNTLKRKVADSYLKFAKRSYDSRSVYDKIVDFWSESPATYKAIITFRVIAFIGCIWGAIHFANTTGQFWLYLLGLVILVGAAIFGIETLVLNFAFGSRREFYLRFAAECGVKTYETPQSEEDYVFAGVKNGETNGSDSDPIESMAKKADELNKKYEKDKESLKGNYTFAKTQEKKILMEQEMEGAGIECEPDE